MLILRGCWCGFAAEFVFIIAEPEESQTEAAR